MDIKKCFLGGITASILLFFLGWLAYVKLFAAFFANHPGTAPWSERTDMLLLYIALGNVLHGFLIAYVFVKSTVNSPFSGLVTGGLIGLLYSAGMDSIIYGTSNMMSKTGAAADVAIVTVMWAITGAVVAMVMGMGKKAA